MVAVFASDRNKNKFFENNKKPFVFWLNSFLSRNSLYFDLK